jgi:hypothetical protein
MGARGVRRHALLTAARAPDAGDPKFGLPLIAIDCH